MQAVSPKENGQATCRTRALPLTFRQLRLVLQLVDPYLLDDQGLGAEQDCILIQVGPLPHSVVVKLENLGVSMEAGILTSGGTLTLFT